MAKKISEHQPPLLKQEIPQMPEGYYSSGPNPNLSRFVEEHATPYDPANDDYNVPPFDKPINTGRSTAIYNMHTYWSKKPHDAISQYIKHYTKLGDIVLDPFCGSGSTLLAVLQEGRTAIANDLSPAATFITKNYCAPLDMHEFRSMYHKLQKMFANEMSALYETRCDRCDGLARHMYTIHSYIFRCNRCLLKIPFYDCVDAEGFTKAGKSKKIRACPKCIQDGKIEEIKSNKNERFEPLPVAIRYECIDGCKPKRNTRKRNDADEKKRRYFEKYDLTKIAAIDETETPYWFPNHRMMNVQSATEPWGDKWRAGTSSFRTVSELYTKRNLQGLSCLLHYITLLECTERCKDALLFAFSSMLLKSSRMMAHNKDGIGRIQKGTYYVPQVQHIVNVERFFDEAVTDLIAGYQDVNLKSLDLLISSGTAENLDIPSNCIDYIFTDPPYAGNVQYGELNFVWEAWLNLDTEWLAACRREEQSCDKVKR